MSSAPSSPSKIGVARSPPARARMRNMPSNHKPSSLVEDAKRLTTPRPFEPDYAKHTARLAEDKRAQKRLARAGYTTTDQLLKLANS